MGDRPIGEQAVAGGLISPEQLAHATTLRSVLGRQSPSLGEMLVDLGYLTRWELASLAADAVAGSKSSASGRIAVDVDQPT